MKLIHSESAGPSAKGTTGEAKLEKKGSIISQVNVEPVKENIWVHKRQVAPGDYKRKLRPEAIEMLDAQFENILIAFDYNN